MDTTAQTDSMIERLESHVAACATRLQEAPTVLVASHIDADDLDSAGIAATALERAGVEADATFWNQLDGDALEEIATREHETVLFTDFGSGQLDQIAEHEAAGAFTPVVVDHHQPADVDADTEYHLNSLLEGIDGAAELSGAGAAYILARALAAVSGDSDDPDAHDGNRNLATLAVVGAVGDRQLRDGELVGVNQQIVDEGIEAGVLHEQTDITFYGRQTRPLPQLLEYADAVWIPGVVDDQKDAVVLYADTLLSINQIAPLLDHAYNTVYDRIRRMEAAFERGFPTVWERIGHTIDGPTQVDETQHVCPGFKGQDSPRDSPSRGGSPEGGRTRWSGEQGEELTLVAACRDVLRVVSAEVGSKYDENLGPLVEEGGDLSQA